MTALTEVPGATDADRVLAAAVAKEVAAATDVVPFDTAGYEPVDPTATFDCGTLKLGFGADGGLITLGEWADAAHPIAQPLYQAMSGDFFHTFTKEYNYKVAGNFDKTGLSLPAMSGNVTLLSLLRKTSGDSSSFIYNASLPSDVHSQRGAPAVIAVRLDVPHAPAASGWTNLSLTLQWFGKTRTHVPETFWMVNRPRVSAPHGWAIEKLGTWVNPADADLGGDDCDPKTGPTTCGVHLHAVGDELGGTVYAGVEGKIAITSLDSALLSVGEPIAVPTPLLAPDALGGVHWALVGNIWNTNYPFWYPFTAGPAATTTTPMFAPTHAQVPMNSFDDRSSQFRFRIALK